jgi:hypothetical protein
MLFGVEVFDLLQVAKPNDAPGRIRLGSRLPDLSTLFRLRGDRDHRRDFVQGLADLLFRNLNVEIVL